MRIRGASGNRKSGETSTRSLVFNRIWIAGAFAVLIGGLLSGWTAVTLFGLIILFCAGGMAAWNRGALTGVFYERTLDEVKTFPGDQITMTVTVANRKPLPVPWLAIEDEMSEALVPRDRATTVSGTSGRRVLQLQTSLGPYEEISWRIPIACTKRGAVSVGPASLRAGDPLGFFTSRRKVDGVLSALIYPRLRELNRVSLPHLQPIGSRRARRFGAPDPTRVAGTREYTPDDPFRAIHWKASARAGSLQVRIVEPATELEIGIFANLDTFDHYWEGLDVDTAEGVIELAASLSVWADAEGHAFGISTNGVVSGTDHPLWLPPSRSRQQLPQALEGLARVSPYSTLPFAKVIGNDARRYARGSALLVITSMMPESLVGEIAMLRLQGRRIVLIPVAGCPIPAIKGLTLRSVDELLRDAPSRTHASERAAR